MLTVSESATILNISPTRVRALITKGILPAQKAGHIWLLREEDVMQRLSEHARAGRPRTQGFSSDAQAKDRSLSDKKQGRWLEEEQRLKQERQLEEARLAEQEKQESIRKKKRELYKACKENLRFRPDIDMLTKAESAEEAAFYVAVADFFLQRRQREVIRQGIF